MNHDHKYHRSKLFFKYHHRYKIRRIGGKCTDISRRDVLVCVCRPIVVGSVRYFRASRYFGPRASFTTCHCTKNVLYSLRPRSNSAMRPKFSSRPPWLLFGSEDSADGTTLETFVDGRRGRLQAVWFVELCLGVWKVLWDMLVWRVWFSCLGILFVGKLNGRWYVIFLERKRIVF